MVAQGWLQVQGNTRRPAGGSTRPAKSTPVPMACRNEPFTKDDMKNPLTEESSFAVLFPAYREKYLREAWPQVTSLLKEHNLNCQVPLSASARVRHVAIRPHSSCHWSTASAVTCLLGLGLGYLGRRCWSTASAASPPCPAKP